jgi:hypothetical protein
VNVCVCVFAVVYAYVRIGVCVSVHAHVCDIKNMKEETTYANNPRGL